MASLVEQLCEMGFPANRAEKALVVTQHKGIEAAMEWLLQHSEDTDIDVPVSEGHLLGGDAEKGGSDSVGDESKKAQAASIKCDQCGKLMKNEAYAQSHATKTGHAQFSESTEEIKPLTEEEKKEQQRHLQQLIKEKRSARLEKEKQEASAREKGRRKGGKEMVEAKQRMEIQEAKKIANQKRREKEEERIAKQKVREQIARDRIEREAKFGKKTEPSAGSQVSSSRGTPVVPQPVQKEYTECRLQIRLHDGSVLRNTFNATDSLKAVLNYVESSTSQSLENYTLATSFPSKIFGPSELHMTLKQAGLLPSAVVIIKRQ